MSDQLPLFPEPEIPMVKDPRRFYRRDYQQQLRRAHAWRHSAEGRPVYHPLKVRSEIRRVLAAGGWRSFGDLCQLIDVGAYGLDYVLEHLLRRGLIESRRLYFGAYPLFPNVPPVPYQGFQFEYRLKPAAGTAPLP
jgi:hypothetical protein